MFVSTPLNAKTSSMKAFVATRTLRAPKVQVQTVAMASWGKKGKASDLRAEFTSAEAIETEVQRLKSELFKMRIKFAKREDYKPSAMKDARKRVAQLLTIKREREVEQGLSRRESLAKQKQKLVEAGLGKFK